MSWIQRKWTITTVLQELDRQIHMVRERLIDEGNQGFSFFDEEHREIWQTASTAGPEPVGAHE